MKKTFTSGLILGALVTLPLTAGSVYWVMEELQKTRAQLLLVEAHTHMKKNDSNRALAKLNQSVGADPYWDLIHLALAELYEEVGDTALALDEYEITKAMCDNCYKKVDEKINRLRIKAENKKLKQ